MLFRSVQLTMATDDPKDDTVEMMDMLLAKKRSPDRRQWLESSGDLATVL